MTTCARRGFLSFIAAAMLVACTLFASVATPGTAYADTVATGTSGTCTWTLDSEGALTVAPTSGTEGTLGTWEGIGKAPWANVAGQIQSVRFEGTVNAQTCLYMFYQCANLVDIDLRGLNTAGVEGMSGMFFGCSSLTDLDLSGLNTANATQMVNMFKGCTNLKNLTLWTTSVSKVTLMTEMFMNCKALTSLDVSGFDSSAVEDFNSMFEGCSKLENLRLVSADTQNPSWLDTSAALGIASMFEGCSSLSSLDVSKFDTSHVTGMSGLFRDCSGLTSLDVTHFNTENAMGMGLMFYGCSGLSSLDVRNFDTAKVGSMSSMFRGCSGLTSLDLTNFNTANVTQMNSMFEGCRGLASLNLSSFNTAKVVNLGYMFMDCTNLTELDLSGFDAGAVQQTLSMFANCSKLRTLTLWAAKPAEAKLTTPSSMFSGCSSLTSLNNLTSLNTAACTTMYAMFKNCSSIETLDLSSFSTSKVKNMASMFDGCSTLKKIVANEDTWELNRDLNSSSNMFRGCTQLAGDEGTAYDASIVDKTRAVIDGFSKTVGQEKPGYLSGTRPSLKNAVVTVSKRYTYDGTAKQPHYNRNEVTVTLDGVEVPGHGNGFYMWPLSGSNASQNYENNVNAGEATVFVKGVVGYRGVGQGTFIIDPVPATVTVTDAAKVYGQADPAFSATVTGLVNNESPNLISYTIGHDDDESVGEHALVATGDELQGNYQVSYVDATLDITPAAATVKADDLEKTAGEKDPKLTATVTGLARGDAPDVISYTLSRTAGEDVGTYAITPEGDADQGNYQVRYENGKLTIRQSAPKVTSLSGAKVTLAKSSATYTGKKQTVGVKSVVLNGKTLKGGTDYTATSAVGTNVGSYKAKITGKGSYNGTVTAAFQIKKATNKVKAASSSVKRAFKVAAVKKKAQTVALPKVTAKFGKASWKTTTGDKKKVLSFKNGKVQVKKGAKVGTYTIKLKASVAGTKNYGTATSSAVTVKVTVR